MDWTMDWAEAPRLGEAVDLAHMDEDLDALLQRPLPVWFDDIMEEEDDEEDDEEEEEEEEKEEREEEVKSGSNSSGSSVTSSSSGSSTIASSCSRKRQPICPQCAPAFNTWWQGTGRPLFQIVPAGDGGFTGGHYVSVCTNMLQDCEKDPQETLFCRIRGRRFYPFGDLRKKNLVFLIDVSHPHQPNEAVVVPEAKVASARAGPMCQVIRYAGAVRWKKVARNPYLDFVRAGEGKNGFIASAAKDALVTEPVTRGPKATVEDLRRAVQRFSRRYSARLERRTIPLLIQRLLAGGLDAEDIREEYATFQKTRAHWSWHVVKPGTTLLEPGQERQSTNKSVVLRLDDEDGIVLERRRGAVRLFETGRGRPGARALLLADGTIELVDEQGKTLWAECATVPPKVEGGVVLVVHSGGYLGLFSKSQTDLPLHKYRF